MSKSLPSQSRWDESPSSGDEYDSGSPTNQHRGGRSAESGDGSWRRRRTSSSASSLLLNWPCLIAIVRAGSRKTRAH